MRDLDGSSIIEVFPLDDAGDGGHPVNSDYVRIFWTSILGPTASALLQLLAYGGGRAWLCADLAALLGIGNQPRRSDGSLHRAMRRLATFGRIDWHPDGTIAVHTTIPSLDGRGLSRLTPGARAAHDAYLEALEASR